jgi:dimethylargininase
MRLTNAFARKPCRALINGLTGSPGLGKPDYEKALTQHAAYVKTLESLGLAVTVLGSDERFPDSCFVEDVAILGEEWAVITNPGAPSRNAETSLIKAPLAKYFDPSRIHRIRPPATIEGGDVMRVDDMFYVGISARTNREGVERFREILKPYGCSVTAVPLKEVLHLKTGVNSIDGGNLLVSGEFINSPIFASFKRHAVPGGEEYAANSLWINGTVIVPSGYPKTASLIKNLGYPVVETDTSEFRKIDGGLSCLSLRF